MLMNFLLVVHGLLALALVGVILMQRSEGGGLGIGGGGGGGGGGLMSARGAADVLTRTTAILATLFIASSLGLAMLAGAARQTAPIDTTLARPADGAPVLMDEDAPSAPPAADLPPIQQ